MLFPLQPYSILYLVFVSSCPHETNSIEFLMKEQRSLIKPGIGLK